MLLRALPSHSRAFVLSTEDIDSERILLPCSSFPLSLWRPRKQPKKTSAMNILDLRKLVCEAPHDLADFLHSLPDDHPLQIALRTYTLALSLALGPALLPFFTSRRVRAQGFKHVLYILKREFSVNAFASAITVGVAGGSAIRHLWDRWEGSTEADSGGDTACRRDDTLGNVRTWLASFKDDQKTVLSNVISSTLAIALLHSRRRHATSAWVGRPSPTLDLSLLLLVRAIDSLVQLALFKPSKASERYLPATVKEQRKATHQKWSTRLDALVFWACSARYVIESVSISK